MHTDNLSSSLQYTHVMLLRSVNCKSIFFKITRYERGSKLSYGFEKDDPKLPRKRNLLRQHEEEEAPVEFVSKVEEYYHHFLSSN